MSAEHFDWALCDPDAPAGTTYKTDVGFDSLIEALRDLAAFLRFGICPAPWEDNAPDYAQRILKADRRITLEGQASLVKIFRVAYEALAGS